MGYRKRRTESISYVPLALYATNLIPSHQQVEGEIQACESKEMSSIHLPQSQRGGIRMNEAQRPDPRNQRQERDDQRTQMQYF